MPRNFQPKNPREEPRIKAFLRNLRNGEQLEWREYKLSYKTGKKSIIILLRNRVYKWAGGVSEYKS